MQTARKIVGGVVMNHQHVGMVDVLWGCFMINYICVKLRFAVQENWKFEILIFSFDVIFGWIIKTLTKLASRILPSFSKTLSGLTSALLYARSRNVLHINHSLSWLIVPISDVIDNLICDNKVASFLRSRHMYNQLNWNYSLSLKWFQLPNFDLQRLSSCSWAKFINELSIRLDN